MTPSLAVIHDDLVGAAATHERIVAEIRARFVERVGNFSPTDAWFEERTAALWDRALVDARVQEAIRSSPPRSFGPAHFEAIANLARAQRGLFEVHPMARTVDVLCVVSGAAFRLAPADDAARAMSHGGEGGWIDGYVVSTPEGVSLLPGFLVHPPEAIEPMRTLIGVDLPFDVLLDGLLAMRHRLAALSRMKAKQVYRADALPRP